MLYWYLRSIMAILNPNITRNVKTRYFVPSFGIKCILVFFNPVLKVNFDGFLKKLAHKMFINISLKHISSNLMVVFVTYGNF